MTYKIEYWDVVGDVKAIIYVTTLRKISLSKLINWTPFFQANRALLRGNLRRKKVSIVDMKFEEFEAVAHIELNMEKIKNKKPYLNLFNYTEEEIYENLNNQNK